MTQSHSGACFCGAVEVEVEGEPIDTGYCHCEDCRSYSGAPFVAFTIWPAENVKVRGDVGTFDKAGTSERTFCRRCGGHLLLVHASLGVVDVRAAILPTVRFEPKAHLYYSRRMVEVRDGLPKFSDMPAEIGGSGKLLPE